MTDRAGTILSGKRGRMERTLGRELLPPVMGPSGPLSQRVRSFLAEEAEDLYWNELEWENITDEEAMEGGPLTELAFPGFLAFIRGLLLREVMPDSLAPASPRPEVVEDVLAFLCARVVELGDALSAEGNDDADAQQAEMEMTSRLVEVVLYRYHELALDDVERIEAERRAGP